MKTAQEAADSLRTVGGVFNYVADVYLHQNRDNPNPLARPTKSRQESIPPAP